MHVTGIVLAAGRSTRMGQPKQLIEIEGLPLVAHVVRAAAASRLDAVVVVTGAEQERVASAAKMVAPACRVVENPQYACGISTSVRSGVAAVPDDSDAVAILLADEPAVDPMAIDAVIAALDQSDALAARASYDDGRGGRKPGHPVVIRRALWGRVGGLTGDEGARRLLAAAGADVLEVAIDSPAPADIDTPEDLAAYAKQTHSGVPK